MRAIACPLPLWGERIFLLGAIIAQKRKEALLLVELNFACTFDALKSERILL